jgi:DNA-binding transcriptional LysR family regulator
MPLPPWTPDLAALDLLLAVAELGSVGRAAAAHGVSQPTASTRLSHLERRLGVELLVRSTSGSQLTPSGEAVVAWAQTVIDAARSLTDGVESLRGDREARLRVAASLTIAEHLLPGWLLALRRRHDDLEIAAAVANSQDVCRAVLAGEADVGFVEAPGVPRELSRRRVGSDRLAVLVVPGHPLARRRRPASALLDQPLLLREPGSGTRETFLRALRRTLGREPALPHTIALGSTTTILATARAGGGIAVVSVLAARSDLAAGSLVEVTVDDLDLGRSLHAIWRGQQPGPLAAELMTLARPR